MPVGREAGEEVGWQPGVGLGPGVAAEGVEGRRASTWPRIGSRRRGRRYRPPEIGVVRG